MAAYSDNFVVIADYRKRSGALGEAWDYVPVEVVPLAYRPVQAAIARLGGSAVLRMAKNKVGRCQLSAVRCQQTVTAEWHCAGGARGDG